MIRFFESGYSDEDVKMLADAIDSAKFDCIHNCFICEHRNACKDLAMFRTHLTEIINKRRYKNEQRNLSRTRI